MLKLPQQDAQDHGPRSVEDALKYLKTDALLLILKLSAAAQGGVLLAWAVLVGTAVHYSADSNWLLLLAAPLVAAACYGLHRCFLSKRAELAKWQQQILLDCGVYLDVFDAQLEQPKPGLAACLLRRRKHEPLTSDRFLSRVSGLVEFFPQICSALEIEPRPPRLALMRKVLLASGSLLLLGLPAALYVSILHSNNVAGRLNEALSNLFFYGVYGEPYYLNLNGEPYRSAWDVAEVTGILLFDVLGLGLVVFAVAWFTLLLPFQRLFRVIEAATLRKVLLEIVTGDT